MGLLAASLVIAGAIIYASDNLNIFGPAIGLIGFVLGLVASFTGLEDR